MFNLFKNSIEKKAAISANNFYLKLLRWENVIGPNKISSWADVSKYPNFEQILNISFNQIQIWEGLRIINKVSPLEYSNYFGKEIGRLMSEDKIDLMRIFADLSSYINNDVSRLYNPTEPLAKWVLLNTLSVKSPTKKQLIEVTMDVHLASENALKLLSSSCQEFRFPDELIIKEYDPNGSLDSHLLKYPN
jgi:hypothetical protein